MSINITITIRKGIQPLKPCSMVIFPICDEIINVVPTGGVNNPIARVEIIVIPICIISIPNCLATGIKTGAIRIIAALVPPINVPRKRQKIITKSKNIFLSASIMA